MLLLLLTLLALVIGSGAWILALGLRMPSLMITAWLVVFIAQTSVVTLVMGAFDHLSSGWLGGASLLVALVEVTCALRWRRSFVGRSAVSILTAMRSALARAWRHPLVSIFGCVVLVAYGWILYLGVRVPAYSYNANAYHLVSPDMWVMTGRLVQTPQNLYSNVYPKGQELLEAFPAVFLRTMQYAVLVQVVMVALGSASVFLLSRLVGARRSFAAIGALGFAAIPVVFLQAGTEYVDVGAAATAFATICIVLAGYALVQMNVERPVATIPERKYHGLLACLLLAGISAGMAASIKSSALATDGIALFVALACYWRLANRREIPDLPYYLASIIALFAVPMLAIASFWYFRTWVGYGSPFYPVIVIGLPGKGTFNNIIIGGNLPDSLAHEPGGKFGQIIGSWATDLHRHTYSYDQRLGGFGIQWPVILVPALVVVGIAWLRKRTQLIWLGIIFTSLVVLLVIGGGWWSRYTIFLPAAGCAALAYVLERLARLRLPWRLAPTVIVLAFMGAATTSMWWAADPPNIVALPGGPHAATFKDAVNLTKLSAAQRAVSVYPWAIQTDLAAMPKGAAIGMFPDDLTFTHPFVGTDLRHELIPLTKTTSASALAREMRALKLRYVVFTEGTSVAYKQKANSRLNAAVTADPQFHYTGLVGGVYGMYVHRLSS